MVGNARIDAVLLRILPSCSPDFRILGSRRLQSLMNGGGIRLVRGGFAFLLGKFGPFLTMAPLSGDRSFPPARAAPGGIPLFLLLRGLLGGWFRMMGCILLTMWLGWRGGPPAPFLLS